MIDIGNDLALIKSSFKNYFKADLRRRYTIKTHSRVFLVLTLSALPGATSN